MLRDLVQKAEESLVQWAGSFCEVREFGGRSLTLAEPFSGALDRIPVNRMVRHERSRISWVVCVELLGLLSGCASGGLVQRPQPEILQAEILGLQARVEETNRKLAQTATTVKDSETRLEESGRRVEAIGERIERIETRLREFEATIKDVKGSMDALTAQVAKPTVRPPVDSVEKLYASARAQYQSRNLGQAILEFTNLIQKSPEHPLAENAQYWMGAAYLAQRDYGQALIEFKKVLDQYPGGRKTPDALYQLGVCYLNLSESQRAREVWTLLIHEFPGSDAARRARISMRDGRFGR